VFKALQAAQEGKDADKLKRYTDILYNQALLVEGLPIDDPITFALEVSKLMV
jgi:molecular chaperone HtpG